jgi:hypothetical protein
MRQLALVVTLGAGLAFAAGQAMTGAQTKTISPTFKSQGVNAGDKAAMIKSALAAAPADIAKDATVVNAKADGTMETLREGHNGFTCLPDNPNTPGKDPMCMDANALKWAHDWMSHAPKPTNVQPGVMYMLQGGSDISATDPWATKTDTFIESPPHWMITWAFDPKVSGLSTTPSKTGTWIMWAGTPYAHLMINQNPKPTAAKPAAAKGK